MHRLLRPDPRDRLRRGPAVAHVLRRVGWRRHRVKEGNVTHRQSFFRADGISCECRVSLRHPGLDRTLGCPRPLLSRARCAVTCYIGATRFRPNDDKHASKGSFVRRPRRQKTGTDVLAGSLESMSAHAIDVSTPHSTPSSRS